MTTRCSSGPPRPDGTGRKPPSSRPIRSSTTPRSSTSSAPRSTHASTRTGDVYLDYTGGSLYAASQIEEHAHERGWDVLVDCAPFAPTNRLDLSMWQPDFVAVSFYKMFGYPTGSAR